MERNSSIGVVEIGNEIHVWHAALNREEKVLSRLRSTLSPDEKARADRFHFDRDKNQYTAARGLLRELLGRYLQQPTAGLEFSYGAHGKPSLAGVNASSGLCFNLAHSSGLAVYAIARERNLGIDVERIEPGSANEEIARRYFSAREVNDLLTLPKEARAEGFFHCWTRKEAYVKALGTGLQTPLDSFSVSLVPEQPAQFLSGVEPRWHIASFHPADGYVAALVYDGAPSSVQFMALL